MRDFYGLMEDIFVYQGTNWLSRWDGFNAWTSPKYILNNREEEQRSRAGTWKQVEQYKHSLYITLNTMAFRSFLLVGEITYPEKKTQHNSLSQEENQRTKMANKTGKRISYIPP